MLPALLLCLATAQDPPDLVSISGNATDSVTGTPLAKVQVIAEPTAGNAARTMTDEKGDFVLLDLTPGEYRLKGIRNGYLDTYYGAIRSDGQGITLTLAAGGNINDLHLKLFPYAVVAGTVRDPDGEPITGARVGLIGVSWRNGVRSRPRHRRLCNHGRSRPVPHPQRPPRQLLCACRAGTLR